MAAYGDLSDVCSNVEQLASDRRNFVELQKICYSLAHDFNRYWIMLLRYQQFPLITAMNGTPSSSAAC